MIVFLVSCLDLGVTLYFSKTNEHFEKANSIALQVWHNHGVIRLSVFKLTITLVSCYCMGWVLRYKERPWRVAVSIFGLVGCVLLIGW